LQLPAEALQRLRVLARDADFEVFAPNDSGLILAVPETALRFPSGSWDLEQVAPEQLRELRQIAEALVALIASMGPAQRAAVVLEVVGHSDAEPVSRAMDFDNFDLSHRRARSVLQFLLDQGLNVARPGAEVCTLENPSAVHVALLGQGPLEARSGYFQARAAEEREAWRRSASPDRRIEIRLGLRLEHVQRCPPRE
jgi:outer membrane protein OmpA-like peptidoglycan-associated protein